MLSQDIFISGFSVSSKMKGFNDGALPGMPYTEFGRSLEEAPAVAKLLTDPEWANKVETEDIEDIKPCIACHNGCFGRLFAGLGTSCALT